MYLFVVLSVFVFICFSSYLFFVAELRAVKIITKLWELKRRHLKRILKSLTGSWPWNFTQTKIMHLEPQRHLKVNYKFSRLLFYKGHVHVILISGHLCVSLTAIGNAYAVLSNTEKRKQYDQYGEERSHPTRHRHQRDFEADISPEDLFNMFFGGGFPSSK